jgi:hypothetical protein
MMNKKFCVFCGRKPDKKTKEHIIPRWLIEITGDPKRKISIGPFVSRYISKGEEELIKEFSYDDFTFPACQKCNEEFGQLEGLVKPIIVRLLSRQKLAAHDIDLLLDWLDKVRIGLWLGFHIYFDENYWGVQPHFYIADRIGKADRALLIYEAKKEFRGIRFIGINTPSFAHTPSCFTLALNEFFLVNISNTLLVSKNMGLPFFEEAEFTEDEKIKGVLVDGLKKLDNQPLEFDYDQRCTVIAQAIFLDPATTPEDVFTEYYNDGYVRDITLHNNRTRPIIHKNNSISFFPPEPSIEWLPLSTHDQDDLLILSYIQTLLIQNYLTKRFEVSNDMPKEKRASYVYEFEQCAKVNLKLISDVQNMDKEPPTIGSTWPPSLRDAS